MKWTIKEIEERISTITDTNDDLIIQLKQDERRGVQLLLKKWTNSQVQKQLRLDKFNQMKVYEKKYFNEGFQNIVGIDEVGRGCLAGPVVAAAVILPPDFFLPGIDDSKKLSEQKRLEYYNYIYGHAKAIGIGMINNEEIDQINIFEATKKAMLSAILQLKVQPDFLLIDAVKLNTPYPSHPLIKGDSLSISIAAASIIAKVTRDNMMKEYDEIYPKYGFKQNVGYGTKEHVNAIQSYGITPIHRRSFSPIKEYLHS